MAKKAQPELTFEQAGAELDALLEELSDENTALERALELYARAAQLIAYCDTALQKAQLTVEEIDEQLQHTLHGAENIAEDEAES